MVSKGIEIKIRSWTDQFHLQERYVLNPFRPLCNRLFRFEIKSYKIAGLSAFIYTIFFFIKFPPSHVLKI